MVKQAAAFAGVAKEIVKVPVAKSKAAPSLNCLPIKHHNIINTTLAESPQMCKQQLRTPPGLLAGGCERSRHGRNPDGSRAQAHGTREAPAAITRGLGTRPARCGAQG